MSVGQKRSQTQTQYQLWLTIGQQFSGYLPVCRFDFVFVTLLSYTRFFSHYFCFAERKPNERLRRPTRFGLGGENTSGRGFYGLLSSSLASFNCLLPDGFCFVVFHLPQKLKAIFISFLILLLSPDQTANTNWWSTRAGGAAKKNFHSISSENSRKIKATTDHLTESQWKVNKNK